MAAPEAAPDKGADANAIEPEEGIANGLDVDTAGANAKPVAASEEVKTDAAATSAPTAPAATAAPADKTTADAKKPAAAAAPAKVSYTPILDGEITTVGICFKAHKKSINLIQVLYCKPVGNSMM